VKPVVDFRNRLRLEISVVFVRLFRGEILGHVVAEIVIGLLGQLLEAPLVLVAHVLLLQID
jgi:hypothetical protein